MLCYSNFLNTIIKKDSCVQIYIYHKNQTDRKECVNRYLPDNLSELVIEYLACDCKVLYKAFYKIKNNKFAYQKNVINTANHSPTYIFRNLLGQNVQLCVKTICIKSYITFYSEIKYKDKDKDKKEIIDLVRPDQTINNI